jgi:hypothetical protein
MPLAVMIFEFIGILTQCAGWSGGEDRREGRENMRREKWSESCRTAAGAGENGT